MSNRPKIKPIHSTTQPSASNGNSHQEEGELLFNDTIQAFPVDPLEAWKFHAKEKEMQALQLQIQYLQEQQRPLREEMGRLLQGWTKRCGIPQERLAAIRPEEAQLWFHVPPKAPEGPPKEKISEPQAIVRGPEDQPEEVVVTEIPSTEG